MTGIVTQQSPYRYQRTNGTQRAYTTVILLTLHQRGEICDGSGTAARTLLTRAQIPNPVVPQGLSNALHRLRGDGIIVTETDGTRTYRIRLSRTLSKTTVEALKREEDWARAFILGKPLPRLTCPPPLLSFANEEANIELTVTEALPVTTENTPVISAPSNGFSVSMDTAVLMRIIAEQARTIRSLRSKQGQHDDDRISGELATFLNEIIS